MGAQSIAAAVKQAVYAEEKGETARVWVVPLIKAVVCALLGSLSLVAAAFYLRLRAMEGFFSAFGLYIILAASAYALLLATAGHIRAYPRLPCMAGMMTGMTLGMVGSFLAGYYTGATNGLFTGSVFGMAVGIGLGAWMGALSGVMGFMEGVMAGFMSGPMGAMTAVMLEKNHVEAMGVIILAIGSVLLAALSYMTVAEQRGQGPERGFPYWRVILLSLLLTGATIGVMAYGPGNKTCPCKRSGVDATPAYILQHNGGARG